uniref:Protein FAM81B n=1 Tax=Callorhinchus milii TaxID=7868 RepID=A0A4W3K900_CALMI
DTKNQSFLHIPMASKNHLQIIDDRLSNQERTTATLLEQAFRIKEDIIASLKGKQNNQTVVGVSQQLLEKHIQIITGILKQLSTDIEVLEGQVRVRDGVAAGTSFAVQSLDLKHLAGIGDLRGRVLVKLMDKIESSNSEYNSKLKTARGDQQHELQLLDFKQRLDTESNRMKHSEPKIAAKLTKAENSIWYELESMKEEYRTGFQSIKDSISSLNEISDKKIRMDKENVQKELKELRRQIIALKNYL